MKRQKGVYGGKRNELPALVWEWNAVYYYSQKYCVLPTPDKHHFML